MGVLYDLYGREGRLPWSVTVHFKVTKVVERIMGSYAYLVIRIKGTPLICDLILTSPPSTIAVDVVVVVNNKLLFL